MFQSLVFGTYIELLGFWFVFECQIPKKFIPVSAMRLSPWISWQVTFSKLRTPRRFFIERRKRTMTMVCSITWNMYIWIYKVPIFATYLFFLYTHISWIMLVFFLLEKTRYSLSAYHNWQPGPKKKLPGETVSPGYIGADGRRLKGGFSNQKGRTSGKVMVILHLQGDDWWWVWLSLHVMEIVRSDLLGRSCLINEVGKTFYLCLSGSFQICDDKEALDFPFRLTKSSRICNDESCLSAFFTIVCHVSSEIEFDWWLGGYFLFYLYIYIYRLENSCFIFVLSTHLCRLDTCCLIIVSVPLLCEPVITPK